MGNQTAREFLLVLFFFYFPMKVARGHILSSRGNSRPPPLNDSPVEGLNYVLCFCFGTFL